MAGSGPGHDALAVLLTVSPSLWFKNRKFPLPLKKGERELDTVRERLSPLPLRQSERVAKTASKTPDALPNGRITLYPKTRAKMASTFLV